MTLSYTATWSFCQQIGCPRQNALDVPGRLAHKMLPTQVETRSLRFRYAVLPQRAAVSGRDPHKY